MIEPIDLARQAEVRSETERYIAQATQLLEYPFSSIPVHFDLSGTTAGMFKVFGDQCCIRYNPWIFAKYFHENMTGTVPHEVAHYIVHVLFPRKRTKPHGAEWQAVMSAFDADPGVTFDLDLSGVPQRRQRSHPYNCGCQEHAVSTTRHNRMQKSRAVYLCRQCNGPLRYNDALGID